MGLLDVFNSEQGRMGLGLLGGGFGQQLRQGVESMDAYKKQQMIAQLQQLQMQRAQAEMADAQEQRKAQAAQAMQQQTNQGAIRKQIEGGGAFDPRAFLAQNPNVDLSAVQDAFKMNSMLNPAAKFETVAPGSSMYKIGPNGPELAMTAPKEESKPEALKIIEAAFGKGSPEYTTAMRNLAVKTSTHQPGTSVSVNTGQKGLDNTLKLRGDFRSEPIYKAHQEVQSAYSQIQQALKMASPAGDLAGATKIMKLLDPGSVVRESELGMAMAASGAMDRLTNYASNIMSGNKLTPTQRKDFQTLADALYQESGKQYNGKRSEYQGIAERNGLSVPDVLGTPVQAQPSGGGKVVDSGSLK